MPDAEHAGQSRLPVSATPHSPHLTSHLCKSQKKKKKLTESAHKQKSPHSGRDVTVQNIADAVSAGLNFAPSFGSALGAQAFALLGLETIDLEDLNAHNVTEHRASLTRDDYRAPGDDSIHVDLGRLRALLADSSTDYLDVASLGRSRVRVEALSGPPALAGTPLTQSLGEAALLLLAMADGPVPAAPNSSANASGVYDDLQAPKDRVAAWFAEEKLPIVLGWQAPSRELGLADIQGVSAAVAVAQQALLSSL